MRKAIYAKLFFKIYTTKLLSAIIIMTPVQLVQIFVYLVRIVLSNYLHLSPSFFAFSLAQYNRLYEHCT